jgi:hypothetical protein
VNVKKSLLCMIALLNVTVFCLKIKGYQADGGEFY